MTEFEQYKQDRLQELEQLKALCLENKENIKALKEYWIELQLHLLYIYLLPKKYEDKYYTEPDRPKTYLGWKFFVFMICLNLGLVMWLDWLGLVK